MNSTKTIGNTTRDIRSIRVPSCFGIVVIAGLDDAGESCTCCSLADGPRRLYEFVPFDSLIVFTIISCFSVSWKKRRTGETFGSPQTCFPWERWQRVSKPFTSYKLSRRAKCLLWLSFVAKVQKNHEIETHIPKRARRGLGIHPHRGEMPGCDTRVQYRSAWDARVRHQDEMPGWNARVRCQGALLTFPALPSSRPLSISLCATARNRPGDPSSACSSLRCAIAFARFWKDKAKKVGFLRPRSIEL